MGRRLLALAAVVILSACGSTGGSQTKASPSGASPSPSASPSGHPELLFAVLQANGPGTYQTGGPMASVNDTVVILDATGATRSRATFSPRTVPSTPGAGVVLEPEARFAAGSVFFADATGMVRRLSPASNSAADVVRFPLNTNQALDFAVSPDGHSLMASVLSVQQASATFALFQASAGGTPAPVQPANLPATPGGGPAVVGWDSVGPVLIIDQQVATQWGTRGQLWFGHAAHLVNGAIGGAIGGPDCWPWSLGPAARVVCLGASGAGPVTVRDTGGSILLSQPIVASDGNFAASPDGTQLAYSSSAYKTSSALLHAYVVSASGPRVQLPDNFAPQGWLDANRIIGVTYPGGAAGGENMGNLAIVDVRSPAALTDLGLKGSFVGVVTSP